MKWDQEFGLENLASLGETHEQVLMTTLSRFQEVLELAGAQCAPHQLTHYLLQLATEFHAYYNAHRFIASGDRLRDARLCLCAAARTVLAAGLTLLGVSAPETM